MLSPALPGAHRHRSSMRLLVKPRRDWPESELMRHTDTLRVAAAVCRFRITTLSPPRRGPLRAAGAAWHGLREPSPRWPVSVPEPALYPTSQSRLSRPAAKTTELGSDQPLQLGRPSRHAAITNERRLGDQARKSRTVALRAPQPRAASHRKPHISSSIPSPRRHGHDLALRRGYRHRPRAPVCCRFLSLIDDTHMRRSCNLSFPAREIVRSEATDVAIWHQVVACTTS
jgi:hypothetical protein